MPAGTRMTRTLERDEPRTVVIGGRSGGDPEQHEQCGPDDLVAGIVGRTGERGRDGAGAVCVRSSPRVLVDAGGEWAREEMRKSLQHLWMSTARNDAGFYMAVGYNDVGHSGARLRSRR